MYQRKALRELRHCSDIAIKPMDKGFVIVVLSKNDYIKEAEQELNHHTYYENVNADPCDTHRKLRSNGIYALQRKNTHRYKKTDNFLIPHHAQTAKLYQRFTNLEILGDQANCVLKCMVSLRKISCALWTTFCNPVSQLFHHTLGTPLGSEGNLRFHLELFW